jgi:hypothetical protein
VSVLPSSTATTDLTKRWSRVELTEWLRIELDPDKPRTIVGIDHGFSLPEAALKLTSCQTWPDLLAWFQNLYETILQNPDSLTINDVRSDLQGSYNSLLGTVSQYRLTEQRCSFAKTTLDLVPKTGCVGPGTHHGIYELSQLLLPRSTTSHIFVWPFDSWDYRDFTDNHLIVEVYPSILKRRVQCISTHPDERDAEAVALWLQDRDQSGILHDHFCPVLTPAEKGRATKEGWILGIM